MTNTSNKDYSRLEKDLSGLVQAENKNDELMRVMEMLSKMSSLNKKTVIYTTYPACNSEN